MLPRGLFRPRRGFTTIEALLAAVVFLLGLSGLLGALTQARNATGQARRYMQATDIANDLLEQMQFWDPTDPMDTRLNATPAGVCTVDPMDKAGALLQPPESSAYQAYALCMRGESNITSGSVKWAGLPSPSFTDEQGNRTDYSRYYIIQSEVVRPGVRRLQIWVKVRYSDAGEPRVVTVQGMRVVMGGA
jgi:type IV pilus assembly protein PilV